MLRRAFSQIAKEWSPEMRLFRKCKQPDLADAIDIARKLLELPEAGLALRTIYTNRPTQTPRMTSAAMLEPTLARMAPHDLTRKGPTFFCQAPRRPSSGPPSGAFRFVFMKHSGRSSPELGGRAPDALASSSRDTDGSMAVHPFRTKFPVLRPDTR